jgi:hypothetical protein
MEMHNRTWLVRIQQFRHFRRIANVGLHEDMLGTPAHGQQIVQISRVGELIEVDHRLVALR